MIEYRKAGIRTFYRIDGDNVTRVINKSWKSTVDVGEIELVSSDVMTDAQTYKPCTEQDFKEQYNIALDRINKMKIE
ncbi:MAG TPA: hypothetical protein VD927_12735 [Chryseosolibacter sp.]|nr:hypothetical protein [Chryseosolibacter sp.]